MPQRDLLLITGIPGAGKTTYGDRFASEFGFVHYDLEDQQMLIRFASNPARFIRELLHQDGSVVGTWVFSRSEPRLDQCFNSRVPDSS